MRAGPLRSRIEIQMRSESGRDSYGGVTSTYVTYMRTWAKVSPVSGNENDSYRHDKALATTQFELRYFKNIDPDMRIVYDGRHYNIVEVIEPDAGATSLRITAFSDATS